MNDEQPRAGTRGGLEFFKWDDVKAQALKDRECYLGQSVRIGAQERFGRFNRFDWWAHQRSAAGDPAKNNNELEIVRLLEAQLLDEAVGLQPARFSLIEGDLTDQQKEELIQLRRQVEQHKEPGGKKEAEAEAAKDADARHERKHHALRERVREQFRRNREASRLRRRDEDDGRREYSQPRQHRRNSHDPPTSRPAAWRDRPSSLSRSPRRRP